jgi:hypothetical protein
MLDEFAEAGYCGRDGRQREPAPGAVGRGTAPVLAAWRKAQLEERLAWGTAWTDAGRVFTKEDGTAAPPLVDQSAVR